MTDIEAQKTSEAETENFLDDDGEEGEEEEDAETSSAGQSTQTKAVMAASAGTAGLNAAAMALNGSIVVIVSSIVAILVSVDVASVQLKLEDTGSLRKAQNELRNQVNALAEQNDELVANNDRLEGEISRLKEHEEKLQAITDEQGGNVNELVNLVKENQKVLDGLKKYVKADTEQTFLKAVLDSDWDNSNEFDDAEIDMLEVRLQAIPGCTVNAKILRSKIHATDRTLGAVMGLLKELDDEYMPDDERIFVIDETHVLKKK